MLQMETPPLRVSRELFAALAAENRHARLERARDGTLIVMPPAGWNSARRNGEIFGQLWLWNRSSGLGVCADSSGGLELPDSAIRAADAAWIAKERWERISLGERESFPPISPDFVVELRSRSDRMVDLRAKMAEYVENGVRLGWLIDPYDRQVDIYRPGKAPEPLSDPATLSGEDVLPGFVLDLAPIFDAGEPIVQPS
jgi:Uma2 family endonuclease